MTTALRTTPADVLEMLRTQDPHRVAVELMTQALDDGQFGKSLSNCHVAGMDSVVLYDELDSGGGMVRFFYTRRGEHPLREIYNSRGHFNLGIHNHKYNLAIVPLVGCINNVETRVLDRYTFGSEILHEYSFASAIVDDDAGPVGVRHQDVRLMEPLDFRRLAAGDVHSMAATDLHTVQVLDREDVTAWMVVESGPQDVQSVIYSPRPDLRISSANLYRPMAERSAIELTEHLLGLAVKG